ncbi:MAG TPA: NUDIX domain-containing protein [Pyrinomonadaceae bacterium]|nr:NUDIX domain-containing protein [Pyrinomonadaceae bacterium]
MIETESAGGIVLDARGRVLVVSQHGTSWSLPKGHVEEGEDYLSAALREIGEESGVTRLELLARLGSYTRDRLSPSGGEDPSERKTIHMFLFRTDEELLRPRDPANPEARWVEPPDVPALLTHAADRDFFVKHCPRPSGPPDTGRASDKADD